MKRGYFILTIIAMLAALAYWLIFNASYAEVAAMTRGEYSELQWLRHEYHIEEENFANIRELHAAHQVECLGYCDALEKSNRHLLQLLRESTEITPEIESSLEEATILRERCRKATLKHIYDVSKEMNPESAKRYREMMTARLVDAGLHEHSAVSPVPLERHDAAPSYDKHEE
tara:strand:- start:13483 stop:14001 length:519 start_codon:yes stop_codon:yes gene_type:complete